MYSVDSIEPSFPGDARLTTSTPKIPKSYKQGSCNTSRRSTANVKERTKKNRKRTHYGEFIIMEAEVDDEYEEGEECEEGASENDIIQDEVDESKAAANYTNICRNNSQPWNFKNDTEIEEYFRKKYSSKNGTEKAYECDDNQICPAIQQQAFLPDIKDPNLWMVACHIGEEKSAAILLMRKYLTFFSTNEELHIKSVVVPEGKNGIIYIESYKLSHIRKAIESIKNLRAGWLKPTMLDIKEKTDIFKYNRPQRDFKSNQLVRVKCGLYKYDLGHLNYVDVAHKKVIVKLLPRINYTANVEVNENAKCEGKKKRTKIRPPPKPLDLNAIRNIGGKIKTEGDHIVFNGNRYSQDGYLYKTFAISAIASEGITPTLEELETFRINTEDLKNAGSLSTKIVIGDNVKVCDGDLENLLGKVSSINGDMVTILPNHKELKNPIVVKYCDLEKYFTIGDHVTVVAGHYKGEKGFVVRVEPKHVVLVSDIGNNEVKLLLNDVQLTENIPAGDDLEYTNKFQFGDFVQSNSYNVGVIVRLNKAYAYVLNVDGKVIECKQSGLQNRTHNEKTATAMDADEKTIMCNSIVTVIKGQYAGLTAEVKHLYRNYAFLHSSMCNENGGIFVARTYHLQSGENNEFHLIDRRNPIGLDMGLPHTNRPRNVYDKFQRNKFKMNSIFGKTIMICKGMYKGSVGIVKYNNEKIARVELHSSCQTISVNMHHISVVDESKKNTVSTSTLPMSSYRQEPTPHTPVYTAAATNTPLINSFASGLDMKPSYVFDDEYITKFY